MIVADELTEFSVDSNSRSWSIPAYQPDRYEYDYVEHPVYALTDSVHTPFTIQTPVGHYIAIHEAALYNYGAMTLKMNNSSLKDGYYAAFWMACAHMLSLPFSTPWRTITIAQDALDLTTSRMMLNLNDPPREDFSWVEPTKFMGIWWAMYVGEWTWAPGDRHGATTEHAMQYIDSCRKLGIPALLVEGWNDGWEGDWLENGVNNKFMQSTPDFDMKAVTDYAQKMVLKLLVIMRQLVLLITTKSSSRMPISI